MNNLNRQEQLEELDKKHIWHPFTQMKDWNQKHPLIIERAEGCYLFDINGKRYLDGISSLWVTVHGHRVKEIDNAIKEQLDKVAHSTLLGLSNVPSIELAAKLADITPGNLNKVFYSDSGSTAVEVALKISFQYWKQCPNPKPRKTKFLHISQSYHGDTLGSVSVGGIDLFHKIYSSLLFETITIPIPQKIEDISVLEEVFHKQSNEIAAFVIEPIMMGAAGMIGHPEGYLRQVRELCNKYDILLICDEVATGFGRTGAMFACQLENVTPDILCIAKGLSGGYLPLAATITNDQIYEAFLGKHTEFKTFFHGHTYTGNPLACAAAIANLNLFEDENVLSQAKTTIEYFRKKLTRIAELEHVGDIRQRGLMIGVELVKNKEKQQPYPIDMKVGYSVTDFCRSLGLILRPLGDVVIIMPPLTISIEQVDFLINVLHKSIQSITEKPLELSFAGHLSNQ